MIRQGFSNNTIKAFQADLRLFTKYMAADTAVNKIEQADIDRFLTWMRGIAACHAVRKLTRAG